MTFNPASHIHTVKEIALIAECPRKWAAKYLHRLEDPKHPNAQDGIDMHAILQAMCTHGPQANTSPESKVGKWARRLYPLTPSNVRSELESTFSLPCGTRRASFKIDFIAPGFDEIGDWKSCAGPKWALAAPNATEAEQQAALENDLQANLEAFGFMQVFRKPQVGLRWLYVDKKTEHSWTVQGKLAYQQAGEWLMARAMPHVKLIEFLRSITLPSVQAVPHDELACGGAGKNCSFMGHCAFQPSPTGLTPQRLLAMVNQ